MSETARRKTAKKTPDSGRVARLCHALSDETRLAILERIRGCECCVCDLADQLGAGQSRLSFHLKTLKDAGLVRDRRDGRWVHYSLDVEALEVLEAYLLSLGRAARAKEDVACCRE